MLFGKNKQQRTRGFQYQPRFWDEKKEEFDGRISDAKRRYHGKEEEGYQPKRNFKFRQDSNSASDRDARFETTYGRVNPWRLIVLIIILCGIVYYMLYL